jgi:methanogenic corrinoid protein MtbC1
LHLLKQIIDSIKADSTLASIKILIGGYPFIQTTSLWEKIGADGFARNADEAVQTAEKWTQMV